MNFRETDKESMEYVSRTHSRNPIPSDDYRIGLHIIKRSVPSLPQHHLLSLPSPNPYHHTQKKLLIHLYDSNFPISSIPSLHRYHILPLLSFDPTPDTDI
jgi:hypothetical protein